MKPDDVSAAAWDAAKEVWEALASTAMTRDQETATLARAIDAAKAEAYGEAAGVAETVAIETFATPQHIETTKFARSTVIAAIRALVTP